RVARKLKAIDVIDVLSDLFILRGVPARIRSGNGTEFVAKAVQEWITAVGAKTAYLEPGKEILYSLKEAQIVIESWRHHYNGVRPHESHGYRPPAPEVVFVPALAVWPAARFGSAPTATLSPASRPALN